MKRTKLFCLPYAGGSSSIYVGWEKNLRAAFDVEPIELSGRGKRYNEKLYESFDQAVDDVYNIISKFISQQQDYAIFGHSLGGLLAYELVYKIKEEGKPYPSHVFFSGSKAPDISVKEEMTYNLPDEEFKQKVFELGGTPKGILESEEFQKLFLPILRSDFMIYETYKYSEKEDKIDCGVTVINGRKEDIKLHEIGRWRKHVGGQCEFFIIDGDHFFINSQKNDVLKIISSVLEGK